MDIYIYIYIFENLTIELYFLYILNMHVKFHLNWKLITIHSINIFLCIILRLQNLEI